MRIISKEQFTNIGQALSLFIFNPVFPSVSKECIMMTQFVSVYDVDKHFKSEVL